MDEGSKVSEPQATEASELTCRLRKHMAKNCRGTRNNSQREKTAAESFISRATEAVINIFSEASPQVQCKEHMNHIMQHIIQKRNEAALDIAEFIWANKQAFGLNQPDGSSTSDHQSGYDPYFENTDILRFLRDTDLSEIYIWNVLLNKIKTFFVCTFIKEGVVSCIAKLRNGPNGFSAEKTPLNAIVLVASEIVEALIPPGNQKKCVFKETQSRIYDDYTVVCEELAKVILDKIGPDDDSVKFSEIECAVRSFIIDLWMWLVFEVDKFDQRNKAVVSLEKIKQLVIDFPKPTEEEPEEPAPPTTVEPDGSDDEEEDISVTPVKESKPLPITSKSDVSDDDEDELIDEDDDSLTPEGTSNNSQSEITAAESFISRATEAVKNIFSEVSPQVQCKEHMDHIMQHIIQKRNEAALDIAEFIWANKQAFGLNQPDGSSTSDHQSRYDPYFEDTDILRFLRDTDLSEIYIWNVLLNKIKTFFVCTFIKEGVVSCIAKLRNGPNGFSAEKTPLNAIVLVASEIVEALIPPGNQKKCVFKETQSRIYDDYTVCEELAKVILDKIGPDDDSVKFSEIECAVRSFIIDLWMWLVFEVDTFDQRNKAVVSLEKIKQLVIDFPKPTEEEPEEPAPPTTVEPDGSDDEEEDISVTPVKESKPLPITSKSDVSDDDEDELIDEDDDSLTPEVPLPNVTAKQPQSIEHIDPFYTLVVSAVLNQIFKKARIHIAVSIKDIKDMSSALALMLCTKLAGSDFVKPSDDKIEKTARAVHKVLCKKIGGGTLFIRLLSKDSVVYEDVTETIKRHLVKPRQTGVKGFFNPCPTPSEPASHMAEKATRSVFNSGP
ncbi:hypothetical protein D5F01_LYC13885 [Larimichthys crocea]|uniref:Uncharacterized protein n=1 Tax=Larimichthys crocea TaxID=215358 RepID=A0A6G0I8G4_LARCR|nr:hypothetical protein D5F01_LYC13885 [Larimichthys crocea]